MVDRSSCRPVPPATVQKARACLAHSHLAGSPIVNNADPTLMISIILGGYDARAEYGVMPAQAEQLSDAEITAIANYLRSSFGNDAPPTTTEAVKTLRSTVASQTAIVP